MEQHCCHSCLISVSVTLSRSAGVGGGVCVCSIAAIVA